VGCGAGASALGAASACLHLFLSEFQLHALSAVHDASSLWAAHPLFGLLQPTSDKVRAIITNAYLMLVFLQGICVPKKARQSRALPDKPGLAYYGYNVINFYNNNAMA
jgi:hypothetical protein